MNEKVIIEKLYKLAEKQQKVLIRLAEALEEDIEATKAWIVSAWQTAELNSGILGIPPESVEYTEATTPTSYTVTGVIPKKERLKFKENFERQVAAQKPELDERIGMMFKD